ncbi:MAG: hypothetical protein MRJ68_15615 [Nitrospira sp.]|nr:hypothetical protein [Nitrospira sp.]
MAMYPSDDTFERDRQKQPNLHRQVLHHLRQDGPTNYSVLYVHFDQHVTGDIGRVLQDLETWNYIEVGHQMLVTITESGMGFLQSRDPR